MQGFGISRPKRSYSAHAAAVHIHKFVGFVHWTTSSRWIAIVMFRMKRDYGHNCGESLPGCICTRKVK